MLWLPYDDIFKIKWKRCNKKHETIVEGHKNIHVHLHVHLHLHLYLHLHIHIHIYICIYTCTCAFACACARGRESGGSGGEWCRVGRWVGGLVSMCWCVCLCVVLVFVSVVLVFVSVVCADSSRLLKMNRFIR